MRIGLFFFRTSFQKVQNQNMFKLKMSAPACFTRLLFFWKELLEKGSSIVSTRVELS